MTDRRDSSAGIAMAARHKVFTVAKSKRDGFFGRRDRQRPCPHDDVRPG
jgi:hypothetical protein